MTIQNVIETEDRSADLARPLRPTKIQPRHLEKLAIVYIRQATLPPVSHPTESITLPYGLKHGVAQLGWPEDRIQVMDEDLGRRATSGQGRPGFQRLVAQVGRDPVGILVGNETSRRTRSCKDWHQLLQICARFGTLIADLNGIYDPADDNDRRLLGRKGTIRAADRHGRPPRRYQGQLTTARRSQNPTAEKEAGDDDTACN